ncbi:hypothetical protein, partial [Ideonella sp.]|uniref:hypothetical protein n=1 Tax=Ideonella sp. TaxID=1929293 RepID=UPI003BB79F0D
MSAPKQSTHPPSGKLERIAQGTLVGWAADPAAPGQEQLSLWLNDQVLNCNFRRVNRADVATALQLAELQLGFEVTLPASLLSDPSDLLARLDLRLNGSLSLRPSRVAPARPNPTPQACAAHVDGLRGLHLIGWLADDPTAPRGLQLCCGSQVLHAPAAMRVQRQDVCKALGLEHPAPGFVFELPAELWQTIPSGADALLEVRAGLQRLGPPVLLRRDQLPGLLDPALRPHDPEQAHRHLRLLHEHLQTAEQLDRLPTSQREELQRLVSHVSGPIRPTAWPGPESRPLPPWLRSRWGCHWRLRALTLWRASGWLPQAAMALEHTWTSQTGLFDPALSLHQNPALASQLDALVSPASCDDLRAQALNAHLAVGEGCSATPAL